MSIISVNNGIGHSWIDRVKAVKNNFDDILFFKFELCDKKNKTISPVFDALSEDAIYKIDDEKEYILSFSFFDKLDGKSALQIKDSEHINVHFKESTNIGAIVDDRKFKLITRTLQQSSKPDSLKISPIPIPNESSLKYEVVAFFEIRKRTLNSILFGLLSAFAFSSIILSQVIGAYAKLSKPTWIICTLSTISIALFGFAGAILFNRFNKK